MCAGAGGKSVGKKTASASLPKGSFVAENLTAVHAKKVTAHGAPRSQCVLLVQNMRIAACHSKGLDPAGVGGLKPMRRSQRALAQQASRVPADTHTKDIKAQQSPERALPILCVWCNRQLELQTAMAPGKNIYGEQTAAALAHQAHQQRIHRQTHTHPQPLMQQSALGYKRRAPPSHSPALSLLLSTSTTSTTSTTSPLSPILSLSYRPRRYRPSSLSFLFYSLPALLLLVFVAAARPTAQALLFVVVVASSHAFKAAIPPRLEHPHSRPPSLLDSSILTQGRHPSSTRASSLKAAIPPRPASTLIQGRYPRVGPSSSSTTKPSLHQCRPQAPSSKVDDVLESKAFRRRSPSSKVDTLSSPRPFVVDILESKALRRRHPHPRSTSSSPKPLVVAIFVQNHSSSPTLVQGHSSSPTLVQGHSSSPTLIQGHSSSPTSSMVDILERRHRRPHSRSRATSIYHARHA
ncbi:hypothetical protein BDZ88DRAFT_440618 [Geranomyces variabilis]|nr:hypothetical protein BDZ88DRAFT_440618 [Geranomyces variabilis]